MKKLLIQWFLTWTDSWNQEMHRQIENRVIEAHKRLFPDGHSNTEDSIKQMRDFYYARMMTTANLLVAACALLLALIAFIVSLVGMVRT